MMATEQSFGANNSAAMSNSAFSSYDYSSDYTYDTSDVSKSRPLNKTEEGKYGGGNISCTGLPERRTSWGGSSVIMRDVSEVSCLSVSGGGFTKINGGESAEYTMRDMQGVEKSMERAIRSMSDLLCVPPSAAAPLLRKFKWDDKALTDAYFGSDNVGAAAGGGQEDETKKDCGVLARCTGASASDHDSNGANPDSGCCAVCLDNDLARNEMFKMKCGHEFCKCCWRGYIIEAISHGPRCVYTTCPHPKCKEIVTEEEVANVTPEVLPHFRKYQIRTYVDTNRLMRWCPGPSCDLVATVSPSLGCISTTMTGAVPEGRCTTCGTLFCLGCGEVPHSPASCDMLSKWIEKCADESETANWMLTSTKKCPKCQRRIEKNGGCHHMHCSQCDFHFCWLCMMDWNVHGYESSCNRYDLEMANGKDGDIIGKAARDLEWYLHHLNRFQAHSDGQEYAKNEIEKYKDQTTTTATTEETTSDSSTKLSFCCPREKKLVDVDLDMYRRVLAQTVECRRVLKNTYVVAYYMDVAHPRRQLYEDHQETLERFTEKLSEHSEKNISGGGLDQSERSKIENLTRVVNMYAMNIMALDLGDI